MRYDVIDVHVIYVFLEGERGEFPHTKFKQTFSILWEQSLDVHPSSACDGFTAYWTDGQF